MPLPIPPDQGKKHVFLKYISTGLFFQKHLPDHYKGIGPTMQLWSSFGSTSSREGLAKHVNTADISAKNEMLGAKNRLHFEIRPRNIEAPGDHTE